MCTNVWDPGEQILRVVGAPTIYEGAPIIKGGAQYLCAVTSV